MAEVSAEVSRMPAGMSVSRPHWRRKEKKGRSSALSGPASVVDLVTRGAQRERKHFSPPSLTRPPPLLLRSFSSSAPPSL